MKFGDMTIKGQADLTPVPYINFFDRDISSGAGTQSVTGLGFKPTSVIFLSAVLSSDMASWGYSTDAQNRCIQHQATGDNFSAGGTTSIRFVTSASFDYYGTVSSMDTDGFTITWVVDLGSPTGSGRIVFMAFK